MRLPFDRSRWLSAWTRWTLAALLIAAPAAFSVATSHAAGKPTAENPHGKFKGDCALCHAANSWKPARISSKFNHASYGFPLSGAHGTTKCMACHSSLDFSQNSQLCANCHQDPHRGEMGTECARCHSARSFIDRSAMVRAHQATQFPLNGGHAEVDCESCHKPTAQGKMQFVGTKADCASCHMDQYRSAKNPDHVAGGFPTDCSNCHNSLSWGTANFDHNKTLFPLTGAHRTVACQSCHINNVFKGTSTDCYSCHKKDYDGTTTPNHATAGYATTCANCHNTTSWAGANFDHSSTGFALTGAHQTLACNSCHTTAGVFSGLSPLCASCHQPNYDATSNPPHKAAGFATTCQDCHTTSSFLTATFNHDTQTKFALTGSHKTLICSQCHGDGVYVGKSMLCYSCHAGVYSPNAVVDHVAANFGTTCETCHNTTAWNPGTFNHNNTTFALTGAHLTRACNDCHSPVFKRVGTCDDCHHQLYLNTATMGAAGVPPHSTNGFPLACETCHDTNAWANGKFNHSATPFPLTGAHLSLICSDCHSSGVFKGLAMDCYSCHGPTDKVPANSYSTPVVNHVAAGFPQTCGQATCHTTATFVTTYDHNGKTTFPLTGSHVGLVCNQCHTGTAFKGMSTLCYSCHADKYKIPTDPNHVTGNFSQACETCHNTTAWTTSTFAHNPATGLSGFHATLTCNGCHVTKLNNDYTSTAPVLCYGCHKADYGTTVANHTAAGFGTACETCHTQTAWTGGKFANHDAQFPIYSGRHTQALSGWTACSDCHTNSANYAVWSCMVRCHSGVPTSNSDHRQVGTSIGTKCLQCHPKGTK